MLTRTLTERRRIVERLMHPRKAVPTFESLIREYVKVTGPNAYQALHRLRREIYDKYEVQVSFGALRKYHDGTSRVPGVILFTAIVGTILGLPE